MAYRIEKLFYQNNYKCVVILTTMGHRCGYVAVNEDHPLYEVDYTQDIGSPLLLEQVKSSPVDEINLINAFCWDGKTSQVSMLCNVHGGVTYSGGTKTYPTNQIDPVWWFGFDCAHLGDAKDFKALKKILPHTKYNHRVECAYGFLSEESVIRDSDYVERECRNLANQLEQIAKVLNKR